MIFDLSAWGNGRNLNTVNKNPAMAAQKESTEK